MCPSNLEILAYEPTPLGILCLRRRELLSEPGAVVTEVTLNHEFLMSSYHTASERALASVALDMSRGQDVQVLVGGLGLGYTASEVLASKRVGQVEVVELLPQVIDWLDRELIPLADSLKDDPRLLVSQGDVYERLWYPPTRRFDVILIDVDHSPEDHLDGANSQFYTEAGLQRARLHLSKDGVLGVWSYAESSHFAEALQRVFREVSINPVIFDNTHINQTITDWLFFARG
jgi:spermidine synthase